jgi:tetratricopeptide (TPR) repeat protein
MSTKKELYNAGLDLYGQGKLAEAIVEYNKALQLDPEDGEIYLAISMAYMRMEDFDQALEVAHKAVEHCPHDALVYTNLSRILQRKGMIPEAEEAMAMSQRLSMGM